MKPLTLTLACCLAALSAAQTFTPKAVPAFRLTDTSGRTVTHQTLTAKPTFVVFLSAGCPHNKAAVKDLNLLARRLKGKAEFAVFVNLDRAEAKTYVQELKLGVPLIADPTGGTMKKMGARHSLDLAVISNRNRRITGFWEGYSAPILREAAERLGIRLDTASMPATRQSGCSI
ncbi:MAG: redoxin domain-containing protein [Fimbriimonadaceae bacterium]|nr:redoxin domain-containing protein [Fimbriimonadaceae bacterium]